MFPTDPSSTAPQPPNGMWGAATTDGRDSSESPIDALVAWLIGPAFLVLAVLMLTGPDRVEVPTTEARPPINPRDISSGPVRSHLGDPPRTDISVYSYRCMECHRLLPPPQKPRPLLTQHQNIVMAHGVNDQCFSCHDRENRDRLVLRDGETISYDDVHLLCANCHGLTFRDWEHGIHGRTNGAWDPALGEVFRLTCTECHDPHAPAAFFRMTALPGPNTMRMGSRLHHTPTVRENPLMQWSLSEHADAEHPEEEGH